MANKISSGPNLALIKGARDLGKATAKLNTVDMSDLSKTFTEQRARWKSEDAAAATAAAKARSAQIGDIQRKTSNYLNKYPLNTDIKVPSQHQATNDLWLGAQRRLYVELADAAANEPSGSEKEYELKQDMQRIISAIKNNSVQWDSYQEDIKEDEIEFKNKDFSEGNNPADMEFTQGFILGTNKSAMPDSNGNLQFWRDDTPVLWNDRPSLVIKSSIAANTLGTEAARIIRKAQKLDPSSELEHRDALIKLIDENPNALMSLASDNLFGAYSVDDSPSGPLPNAYEMLQEEGGETAVRKEVIEYYMERFREIGEKAYNAKKERIAQDNPNGGSGGGFVFDARTDAKITTVQGVVKQDGDKYDGISLDLTGSARDWNITMKEGKIIAKDTKSSQVMVFANWDDLRTLSEEMQKL